MQAPFREYHLLQILNSFDAHTLPLDLWLRNYFRQHKAIGSKDRKVICETIYVLIRYRALLDHVSETSPASWKTRYNTFLSHDLSKLTRDDTIPRAIRASFPQDFYEFLCRSLGEEKAWQFCQICNAQAPVTIRVNTLLTTRDELFIRWKKLYRIRPCRHSLEGMCFEEKINFFGMEEFKQGLFEVQDEGSQLVANLVNAQPKDHILDYCAGSGGKTLAIAPKLQHSGQLFLHDIRPHALLEAKKRLKRAHIQNAQILYPDSPHKSRLIGKMDWVLVDAPCSGTGTLRRNPDMKWKFQESLVDRLVQEQRTIFAEALKYVKPGGHIVYATCSVLPQENEEQSTYFQNQFQLTPVGPPLSTFPAPQEMDGFFGVVFKKEP